MFRALNPHVKDDKRDFTKEAKLLLNAVMVCYLNLLQLMILSSIHMHFDFYISMSFNHCSFGCEDSYARVS